MTRALPFEEPIQLRTGEPEPFELSLQNAYIGDGVYVIDPRVSTPKQLAHAPAQIDALIDAIIESGDTESDIVDTGQRVAWSQDYGRMTSSIMTHPAGSAFIWTDPTRFGRIHPDYALDVLDILTKAEEIEFKTFYVLTAHIESVKPTTLGTKLRQISAEHLVRLCVDAYNSDFHYQRKNHFTEASKASVKSRAKRYETRLMRFAQWYTKWEDKPDLKQRLMKKFDIKESTYYSIRKKAKTENLI